MKSSHVVGRGSARRARNSTTQINTNGGSFCISSTGTLLPSPLCGTGRVDISISLANYPQDYYFVRLLLQGEP
jgi:hypothetical protein